MSNKKIIEEIFEKQEKEVKTWVLWGFLGGHHWEQQRMLQMILYPLLIIVFLIASVMFSYDLVMNFSTLDFGNFDMASFADNKQDLVDMDMILKIVPVGWLIVMVLSIVSSLVWWVYDLGQIEKKYRNQLSCFVKTPAKIKKLSVTYIWLMLLGALGAHRFYLGKYDTGAAMLILGILPFVSIISFCWFMYDIFSIYKTILKENKEKYLANIK
jgi:TM2 domain-containing membrane protein YozV